MAHYPTHNYFVSCAPGLEQLLAGELRTLRCRSVRPQRMGVLFKGTIKDGYRVCLWSRFASRVLLKIAQLDIVSDARFYNEVLQLPWETHLRPDGTLYITSIGSNEIFRNTQFINVRVKDAIVDRFRALKKKRPNITSKHPDLQLHVVMRKKYAQIFIDFASEPLHRRHYRAKEVQVVAPMKETLAAAVVTWGGWPRIAATGAPFVDFMCGSATLPIEAAMIAGDIAPGLLRKRWGFDRWVQHDKVAWERLVDEAQNRRERGLASIPPIYASDISPAHVNIARYGIRQVGLEDYITLSQDDFIEVTRPESSVPGMIALNPPYGERMLEKDELPPLYEYLRETLDGYWDGYRLALITPDQTISAHLGLSPIHTHPVLNGRIETNVYTYDL
ncbi:MAG: hypothetical protein FWD41_03110 [Actinomycetia bacterium]|nr:hypothetical protein [Actinomycetes bacterium]